MCVHMENKATYIKEERRPHIFPKPLLVFVNSLLLCGMLLEARVLVCSRDKRWGSHSWCERGGLGACV